MTSYTKYISRFDKYFKARPYLKNDANGLLHLFDKINSEEDGSDTWWDTSTKNVIQYKMSPGANQNHWKNRTYSTMLDILMVIKNCKLFYNKCP